MGRWTGAPAGSPAPASEPRFGWRDLFVDAGDPRSEQLNSEDHVARTIHVRYGVPVQRAGKRNQSYDLSISDRSFARAAGIEPGNYEVKALWRRGPGRSFDPRFKVGRRGELIYGARDALIKSFAVTLETQIDHILEHSVSHPAWGKRSKDEMRQFVDETHSFIDQAFQRQHSKSFDARLQRLARVAQWIPTMLPIARKVMYDRIQASNIVNGFADLEGIFIAAGPLYTMVSKDEIAQFIKFDSASSEGLKLRYTEKIPNERMRVRVQEACDGNVESGSPPDESRQKAR